MSVKMFTRNKHVLPFIQSTLNSALYVEAGVSGNDFWTFGNGNGNGSNHSRNLGSGTGMEIVFPIFANASGNEKMHSQILGTGMGMKNSFPIFGIGNRRPVFTGMVGNGNAVRKTS